MVWAAGFDPTTSAVRVRRSTRLSYAQPDQNYRAGRGRRFLAHEVSSVVPGAVFGEKDGADLQRLDTTKLIPLLVRAVQELQAEVAELKARR